MTPEQTSAVPAAVGTAFVDSLKAQAAKPFFGILVPNTPAPPTSAAVSPAQAAPAAAVTAPDLEPEVAEPEPVKVPSAKPVSDDAPAAGRGSSSNAGAKSAHEAGSGHRGPR
jgi:hypothetical protein